MRVLLFATIMFSPVLALAGGTRYVVASKSYGQSFTSYPVWTSKEFVSGCTKATIARDTKAQHEFCDDGFAGLKPKVGTVSVGDRVELLDGGNCGEMSSVRLASGDTGCVSSDALSTDPPSAAKPEAPSSTGSGRDTGETPTKWRTSGGGIYIGSNPPLGSEPLR